ncbi:MAG: hypothetical protein EHM80_08270 [Nitrospiraceae bacterium]|nr:MAG: hypothetical protein EHM80_08270 [Nitrospiraceae bacterium]
MKSDLTRLNAHRPIMQSLVGIAACALVIGGCTSGTGTTLGHNAKGTVYLEEVANWSFEASHPAVIDQLTIAKIVKGLYRNDDMTGSSRMPAGGSKPMRIFSDEDAEYLSPLLAQGLSKAKPEQLVGFHISSSAGSGSEPITGSIYVQKGSIYMTIEKGATPTGFMPESVAHIEPAPAYIAGDAVGAMTMIIDYHALAQAPMPETLPITKTSPTTPIAPMSGATPAKAQAVPTSMGQEGRQDEFLSQKLIDLKVAKEALAKKDSEIKMLRKESEWMKRELRDRNEEIKALKLTKVSGKPAPKKKSAHATQVR